MLPNIYNISCPLAPIIINYFPLIIGCIIWHLLWVNIKNWINYKWFTSSKISYNVNELDILNKISAVYIDEYGDNIGT